MSTTTAISLSDLDSYLPSSLWGHAAHEYVTGVVTEFTTDREHGNVDPGSLDEWADNGADSDVTYYADTYRLWDTLQAWNYADDNGMPAFSTAREALQLETFTACQTIRFAIATLITEGI